MNTAGLRAALMKNKTALGVAGAVLVGALALRARSKTGTSSAVAAPATTTAGVSATPSYYTAGNGAATGYDSTASDVYSAIQPQIEQLNTVVGSLAKTVPVPSTSPQGFYRAAGSQAVYQANADGTRTWLDRGQYDALGDPQVQDIARNDPIFSRPLTGTDAPAQFR